MNIQWITASVRIGAVNILKEKNSYDEKAFGSTFSHQNNTKQNDHEVEYNV